MPHVILMFFLVGCEAQQCTHVTLPDELPPRLRALYSKALAGSASTEICTVGDYKVAVVGKKGRQSVVVQRGDTGLLIADPTYSTLIANNVPLATVTFASTGVTPSGFSYSVDDRRTGATILVSDADLDGQSELRGRIYPDRRSESEVWFQDKWQRLVKNGSVLGLFVDGHFMTVPELLHSAESKQDRDPK